MGAWCDECEGVDELIVARDALEAERDRLLGVIERVRHAIDNGAPTQGPMDWHGAWSQAYGWLCDDIRAALDGEGGG